MTGAEEFFTWITGGDGSWLPLAHGEFNVSNINKTTVKTILFFT